MIGNKIINEDFFKKIDLVENDILDGKDFDQLTMEYRDNVKETLFVNSEGLQINGNVFKEIDEETFAKMFDITEPNVPNFVNNKNNYYLIELVESKQEMLNLKSKGLKEKIVNQIKLINQIENISRIINDIDENKFGKKEFENFAKENNAVINTLTLKNIEDTSKFNNQSLKKIYEFKLGSIFVLPDENENYIVSIINEKNPKINNNSEKYKNYALKSKELYVSKIYKSYDNYINKNYKIDINKNVLERIENSF